MGEEKPGKEEKEEKKEKGKEGGEAAEEELVSSEEAFRSLCAKAKEATKITTQYSQFSGWRDWLSYVRRDAYARELIFYLLFTAIFTFGAPVHAPWSFFGPGKFFCFPRAEPPSRLRPRSGVRRAARVEHVHPHQPVARCAPAFGRERGGTGDRDRPRL